MDFLTPPERPQALLAITTCLSLAPRALIALDEQPPAPIFFRLRPAPLQGPLAPVR